MSRFDKLINNILKLDKNLRYDDLSKALQRIGYKLQQPSGGSSHVTFRKEGCAPVTLVKSSATRIDIVYITIVKDAVIKYLHDGGGK